MVRFIFRCESGEDAVKYKKYLEKAITGNRDAAVRLALERGIDAFPGVVMDIDARFSCSDEDVTEFCLFRNMDVHHWEIENLPPIAE